MSEQATAANQAMIITLTDEAGQQFEFKVIERIRIEEQDYLLALLDGSESNELAAIGVYGEDLRLVQDEPTLNQIRAVLSELAQQPVTVTLVDENGQSFEFNVVKELDIDDQHYLLAQNPNNEQNQVIVLRASGQNLEPVEDAAELARVQSVLDLETAQDQNLSVKLETADGKEVDFAIVGRLNLEGHEYLLAAAEQDNPELLAIEMVGEELRLVQDEATLAQINEQIALLSQNVQQA